MLLKTLGRQLAAASLGLVISTAGIAAQAGRQPHAGASKPAAPHATDKKKNRTTPGANFRLTVSREDPGRFNLLVSDGEEAVISGSHTVEQVKNFRDVLAEARAFALTEEASGGNEPQTTRFFNDEDDALIIDVMKFENQSQFFITYETEIGRITIEGGTVDRREKKEAGLFYDLLSKVEAELKKQAPAPK